MTGLAATGIATQAQSVVLRAVGVVAIGVLIMLSIPHLPLDVAHFKVASIFAAISRAYGVQCKIVSLLTVNDLTK